MKQYQLKKVAMRRCACGRKRFRTDQKCTVCRNPEFFAHAAKAVAPKRKVEARR